MTPSGWGTWTPERPAALSDPAAGFALTPLLYADRAGRASLIPPGPAIVYGPRSLDGASVAFETRHEDTRLAWRYHLADPETIAIEWRTLALGEWGLRFWVVLCVTGPEGAAYGHDADRGVFTLQGDASETRLEIRAAKDPLLVTYHEDHAALVRELEVKGYFYLASRRAEGALAALRFNLEEAPAMRIVAARRAPEAPSVERPTLPSQPAADPPEPPAAQASLQAVHDVIAWNHVHDRVNDRPYTLATRAWNARKFGGFGLWMTDTLYHALLWSPFDPAKARDNLEALFAWQTEAGNLPCLITGNDRWVDRSQPPVASFIVWRLWAFTGDRALLDWAYPILLRNHDWWWRERSLGDSGLVAYGTSPGVGEGLYRGTKLGAKNESSMDNMPVHDPAPFDPETGLLLSADVGLNSLLALDGEVLALMAGALGREAEQRRLAERSEGLRARIASELWDDDRGVFANRLASGDFVAPLAPTSFFPMVAGAASPEQCDSLIARYLHAPDKFGGRFGLPSVTRDDPAYPDNVYWRGRIWGPLNFWVYQGLRRCGREAEATTLAAKSAALFQESWRDRLCGENYNAEGGAITDSADSDSFYAWGALLPLLQVLEVADATPWDGLSLTPGLAEGAFGPLRTPLGRLAVAGRRGDWALRRNGRPWLSGTLDGRLSAVEESAEGFSARLPATPAGRRLSFEGRGIATASLDGAPLAAAEGTLTLPACDAGARLELRFEDGDAA